MICVSSDNDAAQKDHYMEKKHGDWLSVSFDDKLRATSSRPSTAALLERSRCSLASSGARVSFGVINGPTGDELVHMDCDPPTEINRKGDAILDEWLQHQWPRRRNKQPSATCYSLFSHVLACLLSGLTKGKCAERQDLREWVPERWG